MRQTYTGVGIVILLFASLAQAYGPNGEEDRCTELGANCSVSEPLNTNSLSDLGGYSWNPNDTATSSTNTINFYPGRSVNPNSQVILESNLTSGGYGDLMPAGNQVTYVTRTGFQNGEYPMLEGDHTGSGINRVCQRQYFMRDKDMVIQDNLKDAEMGIGDNCQYILGNGSQGNGVIFMNLNTCGTVTNKCSASCGEGSCGGYNAYTDPDCIGRGSLNQTSCTGHWCRAEFCVYGALNGSGNVFVEGYVIRVDNPSINLTFGPYSLGDLVGNGTGSVLGNKIFSGYETNNTNAAKLISHMMQATWSTNSPGLFIGPAVEVEGGTGPPPPPSAAPAAPVLLP